MNKDIQIRCETLVLNADDKWYWAAAPTSGWNWDSFCSPEDASSHELYSAWKGEYNQGDRAKEAALKEWKLRSSNENVAYHECCKLKDWAKEIDEAANGKT